MNEAVFIEKLGWEAVFQAQPSGSLPAWIIFNSTGLKRQVREGLWELEICLYKKRKMNPGEAWDRLPDGYKVLACTDPITGEKRYVIHDEVSDDDRVTLFRVEIEVPSHEVSIKEAVNPEEIDPSLYEIYYEDLAQLIARERI